MNSVLEEDLWAALAEAIEEAPSMAIEHCTGWYRPLFPELQALDAPSINLGTAIHRQMVLDEETTR